MTHNEALLLIFLIISVIAIVVSVVSELINRIIDYLNEDSLTREEAEKALNKTK